MFFSKVSNNDKEIIRAIKLSHAIIEFSLDGTILTANNKFLNMMGYYLDEIIGRHHSLFCDSAYAASDDYQNFWSELVKGNLNSNEFERFGKGGNIIWLQGAYCPVKDEYGRVLKVIQFAVDITAQKISTDQIIGKITAIERSQAVIEFTPAGEVITANENFLKLFGYQLDDIRGRHHRIFCSASETASSDYGLFWDALSRGEFKTGEFQRISNLGNKVYVQASYNPILDNTGTVIKIVKFAIDTTEAVKKRIESDNVGKNINIKLCNILDQIITATEMASSAVNASSHTTLMINSAASSSEELTLSVGNISDNMRGAKFEVHSVFRHAQKANDAVAILNSSANAMNNIVPLISDIASQISLLALNATIESARAGEAGKGFSVVASEVKNLAIQATAAVKTIGEEVSNVQSMTTEVVGAIGFISESLTSVHDNVSSVADVVLDQHIFTDRILSTMQNALLNVKNIEDCLCEISKTFNIVAVATEHVKMSVEELSA